MELIWFELERAAQRLFSILEFAQGPLLRCEFNESLCMVRMNEVELAKCMTSVFMQILETQQDAALRHGFEVRRGRLQCSRYDATRLVQPPQLTQLGRKISQAACTGVLPLAENRATQLHDRRGGG